MRTLYLCGAGNSEGIRLAQSVNTAQRRWDRLVLLDDDATKHGRHVLDVAIAGPFARLANADLATSAVVNLVARTTQRRTDARARIAAYGVPFATLAHPAVDTAWSRLEEGVLVYEHSIISPETVVWVKGRWCSCAPSSATRASSDAAASSPRARCSTRASCSATVADAELVSKVAAVWAEVLGRPVTDSTDNFCHLGGTSLQALRVLEGLRRQHGIDVPVTAFFRFPTVRSFVAHLVNPHDDGVAQAAQARAALRRSRVARGPLRG